MVNFVYVTFESELKKVTVFSLLNDSDIMNVISIEVVRRKLKKKPVPKIFR